MKHFIVALLSLLSVAVAAQDSVAVVRVGYIDKALFISFMPETQEANAALDKLKADYETELSTMTSAYNDKVRLYLEQKETMSEAIKLARQTEITEAELTIDLYKRRYLADLDAKREAAMTPIYASVDEAIRAVARSLSLTIVFDQSTPLYVSEGCIDITDAVHSQFKN